MHRRRKFVPAMIKTVAKFAKFSPCKSFKKVHSGAPAEKGIYMQTAGCRTWKSLEISRKSLVFHWESPHQTCRGGAGLSCRFQELQRAKGIGSQLPVRDRLVLAGTGAKSVQICGLQTYIHINSIYTNKCIYIHIYIYTETYIYIYIYVRAYVRTLCMYVCMYLFIYVCMHACMCVCMCACMCVCMYVCMHACMHVCMYVCNVRNA